LPARGLVQSPVLVGRDDYLALAGRRLAEAADGAGQLLFVAGEAGIGKTRLLGAVSSQAEARAFTVIRAAAFPGDGQSLAGLLLDLAGSLRSAPVPALAAAGAALTGRLRELVTTAGDAHHRRRLLIQDVTDLLLPPGASSPVLIVLEDVHWADELSLDVLGHLARRLAGRPVLATAAYRSDELYPRLPMRELRARLVGQRLAEEIRLPRLTAAQTARMTSATLGRPVPAQVLAAIQDRTDGIPLHVEEFLAAVDEDALTTQSAVQAAAVPDTLADAVLTRASRLSDCAREVAAAGAVLGRSFDFDLLTAITLADPDQVAGALRELQDAYLLLPGADAATFDFRHTLIRDTLYADIDLPLRRRLHDRAARAASERGYRDAFVSAHFEQAQNFALGYARAVTAGREAAALSAHGEALELYRRAVRCQPADLPVRDRVWLLAAEGDEAAATDDNTAAAAAYRAAHDLALGAGGVRAAAALVPRMTSVGHLLGDRLETRIDALQAALASIDGTPGPDAEASPGGTATADSDRAALLSALAAAYMLARRLDEAIDLGYRAADASGDGEVALNTSVTLGSALLFAGRMDEGWRLLETAADQARDTKQEAEAARAYRMLGSSASVLVEYGRAERWLTEGIGYAEQVEMWNDRHYMAAHLAHVQWCTGDFDAAARTADYALADGRGGITTEITARYVLGYLALGRADWDSATDLLTEALAQGERMAELQRLSPPLWGLAEAARCRDDFDTAVQLCERGYEASAAVTDAAYLFPFLLTGTRAHLARGDVDAAAEWSDRVAAMVSARAIPGTLPAVGHSRGLILLATGELPAATQALEQASADWQAQRRFWEGSWALLDLATAALRSRRPGAAATLLAEASATAAAAGATALADAARRLADAGRAGPAAEPWHPLSAREFEVARLVAAGCTNREIAEQLTVAPKTVSAHVTHILVKLGAGRRAEIAAWCATVQDQPRP
jgi:DNA-binding CsgD family transcriptional regulator